MGQQTPKQKVSDKKDCDWSKVVQYLSDRSLRKAESYFEKCKYLKI